MDDLVRVLIFAGIFFFLSALGSGKRKQPPQQRPPERLRRPEPAARPRPGTVGRATPPRAQLPGAGRPEPESLTDALFAVLRGEVPAPPGAQQRGEVILDAPEAVSLETLEPAGEASHERFEKEYVEHPATFEVHGGRRARRVHLTPKTAREAVVWTAIFSRPKGLQ